GLRLGVIMATGPGRSSGTESPHSGARPATEITPLPFGPQTGIPADSATSLSSRSRSSPPGASPNPAEKTIAPRQPRSAASASDTGTFAAGIAKTTASTASGSSPGDGAHTP